ncbi:hypothetical protein P167DRAFT_395681 [Morchella conica CCBAS932]|uniref:Uncharacterized protein n=1 Tax=Morchella conica CCBAS932 TaxID=1392247 RepID=A0A3N4KAT6_9PEZI|nr:hypothetical protein P167DRAFT_395681 [Morchella conica CCBAS932]
MFLPRPCALLFCALSFFLALALCDPLPQATVYTTAIITVTPSILSSTPTRTGPPTSCVVSRITGTDTTVPVIGNVRFRTEPSGRGTIGILISCTATYIFCVWTTVHPAVGETGKRRLRLWYKLVLTSIAITVPAGVMIYAFDEWRQARRLVNEWEANVKYHPKPEDGSHGGRPPKGPAKTLARGTDDFVPLHIGTAFFVLMGGFRIDNKHAEWSHMTKKERKKWNKKNIGGEEVYERPILSPQGFIKYVQSGRINQSTFNQVDVLDKGKGSNIAKIFAGFQALWLILQSIARWADNLPLTVLEIHVLIQIVCTSVIYAFWFRKPLDVGVPTTIKLAPALGRLPENENTPQSPGSTKIPQSPGSPISRPYVGGETLHIRTGTPSPSPFFRSDTRASRMTASTYNGNDAITITGSDAEYSDFVERPSENEEKQYIDESDTLTRKDMLYKPAVTRPLKAASSVQAKWVPVTAKAFLDVAAHVRPLEKAKNVDDETTSGQPQPQSKGEGEIPGPGPGLLRHSTTWKERIQCSETGFTAMMVVAQGFLVVLVASLHLGAWNTKFPSAAELWLWRASCFSMIGFPTWIVAVICFNNFDPLMASKNYDHDMVDILWLTHVEPDLNPSRVPQFALKNIHKAIKRHSLRASEVALPDKEKGTGSKQFRKAKMVQHYIMLYSCFFAVIFYGIASLFIAVESYLAMRYLEDKHFQSPRWSNFIPHF